MQKKFFEPTWESVKTHTLPQWYDDCKLGIFIHWGLYSVPAWAEVTWELGAEPPPRNGSGIIPTRNGI